MKLRKLHLNNIRSYKEGTIIFPEGSTILSGDIGSGKTTILLAIEFALFGLQPGQRGTSLLSSSQSSGQVILEMEIDGHEVIIERSLKRSSGSVTQDYSAISIDGNKRELSVTELKSIVLELISYPSEFMKKTNLLYRYTLYTPQEEMKEIILEDPESRLNILRHIFGIDKYKRIRENLITITAKIREQSRILQTEIRDIDEVKNMIASQQEFVRSLLSSLITKESTLKERISHRKKIEEENKALQEKIKERQKFEKEIEKTTLALSYKINEESKLGKEILELTENIKNSPIFDEKSYSQLVKALEDKRARISFFENKYFEISTTINSIELKTQEDLSKKERIFKLDLCPTCLQNVSENHKHNILNETEHSLKNSEKEIISLKQKQEESFSILNKEKQEYLLFESKRAELDLARSQLQAKAITQERLKEKIKMRENLTNDISLLKSHITLMKQSMLEFSKYENQANIKERELKTAFHSEKQAEIEIAETKKEIELIRRSVHEREQDLAKKENTKQSLLRLLEIEQWLSNEFLELISYTERNILLKLRNEFSKHFNKWFSMLTTESFYVHLDESFTPVILQGDFELDYSFLSGGERTAVALAYRLALNQIINSFFSTIKTKDIVILDEPTEGFSSQQLDKVRDILIELNIAQLIIVSHEPKIESFVDNVIKITKEAGSSKISEADIE